MAISLYQASVPVFVRALHNLRHILEKGAAHARQRGVDPDSLLQLRLIDDMLPLSRQVQIACDMAKNGAARLAGQEPMPLADEEATLDQLYARIARTIELVEAVEAGKVDGSEGREIVLKMRSGEMRFNGQDYLLKFVLPNLYFHVTTTYALLRREGAPLGKMDFIAGPDAPA
ncbi:DUF1993 domain-containing protein [Lysobacter sp. TY2-98]|uniref:DUF1993 domain-containing protein n=1 Tax=Lysobacter sp. TY2-98 TaxID=2290922 RepID=UPI000E1FD4A1|nr:DUF1993 domain-containing protein [Lysobacter sp. TY2-98]AXK72088.1 DUF1993 domain-containing protein [Lysobacter sp. TY2-98]